MLLSVAWHLLVEPGAWCVTSEDSMRDGSPQFDLTRSSTDYGVFHLYECPCRCSSNAVQRNLQH